MSVNINDTMRFFRLPFWACKNEDVMMPLIFTAIYHLVTLKLEFLKHGRLKCVQWELVVLSLLSF